MRRGLLLSVVAVAAFLRFDKLGAPSYWLDEILGDMLTTHHAHGPWWHWITGLEREHGPLYYAAQLAARALGRDEFAGRLPAALFGLAAIPLIFLAARALGGWAAGIAAAIVLAVSPLHVYYSREARPYALLMLLTAVLLWALLHNRLWIAVAVMIAMLYTSAVAGPLLLAIAITCFIRRLWTFGAAATIAAALVPLLYRGEAQPSPSHFDESVLSRIAGAMTVSARGLEGHELTIAFLFLFAAIGAVLLWRRDKRAATIVLGVTLLPIVCALVSLAVINHWFAIRYVSPALIGFVVLAAVGMTSIRLPWIGVLVAAVIAADTWTAARREPFEKLDWRAIGAALERHVQPGDAIVTAEQWSDVCLRYYLRHLPPRVRVVSVNSVMLAEMFANAQPTWFVTAGEADPTPVRDAICRYPLLAAGELEGFRLHYAPSLQHFVQHRAAPEDLRALATALGPNVALHSGRDEELFRGDGWQGPEGAKGQEFRWATAKEASLRIPRLAPRDRRVVVTALPLAHRTLAPQTMTLSVNGTPVSTVTMPFEWRDYAFDAPAKLWREGLNTLTFTFGRVTIPATLGPPLSDPRPLAVCFESVSITESAAAQPPPPVIDIRFASNTLFRTRCALVRKHAEVHWREDAVKALYARLGFDPPNELHPEEAVTTIAIESACESDRAFLDRAFYVIAERNPNTGELADLVPRLQRGAERVEIVGRVLKAIDVRKKLTK
ncbi:MAG TPA: glycosyltransferase family 39 protein [Thermoanaerobaculia bacterium]|nr:glycosyltransferase family 39 protein [Thermoanaerobaculia bacterium]